MNALRDMVLGIVGVLFTAFVLVLGIIVVIPLLIIGGIVVWWEGRI